MITNTVNGKVYVGQTRKSVRVRFLQHIQGAKSRSEILYRAMRKYGTENFKLDILESGLHAAELDDYERFWISRLDSKAPRGYNANCGGCGDTSSKRTGHTSWIRGKRMAEETRRKISESLYARASSEEALVQRAEHSKWMRAHGQTPERRARLDAGLLKYLETRGWKGVICTDLLTGGTLEFKSRTDCAKFLGVSPSCVTSIFLKGTPFRDRWQLKNSRDQ